MGPCPTRPNNFPAPSPAHPPAQVKEQQREWQELYNAFRTACLAVQQQQQPGGGGGSKAPPTRDEFYWAMCCVRSRTFSGPYIGSTLTDRLRLAGLVAVLVVGNTALGLADPQVGSGSVVRVAQLRRSYKAGGARVPERVC